MGRKGKWYVKQKRTVDDNSMNLEWRVRVAGMNHKLQAGRQKVGRVAKHERRTMKQLW